MNNEHKTYKSLTLCTKILCELLREGEQSLDEAGQEAIKGWEKQVWR